MLENPEKISMIEIPYSEVVTDELSQGAILNEEYIGFREDYLALHCLLRKHKPFTLFEIGTNMGTGTKIIKHALGDESRVYSLDLPTELAHISLQHPINEGKGDSVGHRCDLPFIQLRGDSLNFDYFEAVGNVPIDAWFIDGEHDYTHPYNEALTAILSGANLIIFHDADIAEVNQAIVDAFSYKEESDTLDNYDVYRVQGTRIAYALKKRSNLSDLPYTAYPIDKKEEAIIVIAFNNQRFVDMQIKQCRTFNPAATVIIYDNSTEGYCVDVPHQDGVVYMRHKQSLNTNPSEHHSNAATAAYNHFKWVFNRILILDHDCFPIFPFTLKGMLGNNMLAGLCQRKAKDYLWAGCVAFDSEGLIDNGDEVDLHVDTELFLDSGGKLYPLVEKYAEKGLCRFINEEYESNPATSELITMYQSYALLNNKTFIHFINGSNWNKEVSNEERINSLFAILNQKSQENEILMNQAL
jgi:predicted O-methyltransferase YrrM